MESPVRDLSWLTFKEPGNKWIDNFKLDPELLE
jgi:hypothetical protein